MDALERHPLSIRLAELPAWVLAVAGAVLCWLAQPPLGISELAWFAIIPWLMYATRAVNTVRDHLRFYLIATLYWAITMQGLRHAHPAMYFAWGAFALYLACYSLAFVVVVGRVASRRARIVPTWLAIPIIGTGLELVRNYLLTGISAAMIGHTQANRAVVIQLADLFGSYGVTFLVLLVNAAIYQAWFVGERLPSRRYFPLVISFVTLMANLGYGQWRLAQAEKFADENFSDVTIALIGRDEPIVFEQDSQRELQIFDAYLRQSMDAANEVAAAGGQVDAIVWPESMFTGSLPWILPLDETASQQSSGEPTNEAELKDIIAENRMHFQRRAAQVQALVRRATGQSNDPHLIVGCTVIRYDDPPKIFSSVVHVGQQGQVADWYGKIHLVMFGEYIPLIDYLPWINTIVPPGMGVQPGAGPVPMHVGELTLSPNVCIETAVERVARAQIAELKRQGVAADAIVNVTNDGWFDGTSIVEHHLRCSQLVAVSCRRPVLISANGGPTAWIDGCGRIIKRLDNHQAGAIIADVTTDGRWGWYQTIGDWPARVMAMLTLAIFTLTLFNRTTAQKTVFNDAPPA